MNNYLVTLMLIGGIIIRFGIPIVITFVLSAGLQKLDQKWRKEAKIASKKKQVTALMVVDIEVIPCWIFNQCPETKFKNCVISNNPRQICWESKYSKGKINAECIVCEYRNFIVTEKETEELMLV